MIGQVEPCSCKRHSRGPEKTGSIDYPIIRIKRMVTKKCIKYQISYETWSLGYVNVNVPTRKRYTID